MDFAYVSASFEADRLHKQTEQGWTPSPILQAERQAWVSDIAQVFSEIWMRNLFEGWRRELQSLYGFQFSEIVFAKCQRK